MALFYLCRSRLRSGPLYRTGVGRRFLARRLRWKVMLSLCQMRWCLWVLFLGNSYNVVAAGVETADLRALYNSHQWFRLRQAVDAGKSASAFYRGAVAAAFHDPEQAKQQLQSAVASSPEAEGARQSRHLLEKVAWESGSLRWGSAPWQESKLNVGQRAYSRSRYSINQGRLVMTALINCSAGNYVLGLESQRSILSQSEAKRVGLAVVSKRDEITGGETGIEEPAQLAVAHRLSILKTDVKKVGFSVRPDSHFAAGESGVIGLDVLFALQTIRWNRDITTFETGFPPVANRTGDDTPNIWLDEEC